MSAHNGSIYVWGGHHQGQYLNDLYMFNIKECEFFKEKSRVVKYEASVLIEQ